MKTSWVVIAFLAAITSAMAFSGSSAVASHCLTGPYKVQGSAAGVNGAITIKASGKFIGSGLDGCFASGTGSYSAQIGALASKGALAVHTDVTEAWTDVTASHVLYLPSLIKTGPLVGNTVVIVACQQGNVSVRLPKPAEWDSPTANHTYDCDVAGRLFVSVVNEPDRSIILDASGLGVVSGP